MGCYVIDTDELRKKGYSNQLIGKIKLCAPRQASESEAALFRMSDARVMELLGLSEMEMQGLAKDHSLPPKKGQSGERYYDAREIIKALYQKAKGGDNSVDKDLKLARKKKLDIENALHERELVSRKKAEERNVKILQAVSTIIQRAIKTASVMVVGCVNSLDAEEIIRSQYKDALRMLKEQGDNKEWLEAAPNEKA